MLGRKLIYPEDFDEIIILDPQQFGNLSAAIQVGCCLHMLEAEVNNGGFDQFFLNSSGYYALQTMNALARIGAPKTRALLENAIKLAYPDGYPDNPEDHEDTAHSEEVLNRLGELDGEFCKYEEPLTDLTNKFLAGATQ
jgi:hypothetical protein